MTCRDEVLDAAEKLIGDGIDPFSPDDVKKEMRRRGSTYEENTISTHVTSRMCANAPINHARVYDDLVRVGHGLYSLNKLE